MTSHAAVVARGMGKCAVTGASGSGMRIETTHTVVTTATETPSIPSEATTAAAAPVTAATMPALKMPSAESRSECLPIFYPSIYEFRYISA
jgi:hypothetical protein